MTDDELIESMARLMFERDDAPIEAFGDYVENSRAALAVAKRELFERAAKVADEESGAEAGEIAKSYVATVIAARIRGLADER